MTETLATAIRPADFASVIGQEHPVRYLSQLILRGRVGRHILLHGTVGSGKTTLARIYGQALLCTAPIGGDGSPCRLCDSCKAVEANEPGSGFAEYDVGGTGGERDVLQAWLDRQTAKANGKRRRVLFLDEAHGLSEAASSSLLKPIEEAGADTVFIFATSEHHNLTAALRSRLVPLKVRPLNLVEATEVLRQAAAIKQLQYDDDALVMLANLVARQPRDLLNALDQLIGYGRITIAVLREVLDFEYLDVLRDYLTAMGRQDRDRLNELIAGWRDTGEVKLRWILALLAGVYSRDILRLPVDVDPVLEQLAAERQTALVGLRERYGVSRTYELAPYWRQLMGHWRPEVVEADGAFVEASFVAFHELLAPPQHDSEPNQKPSEVSADAPPDGFLHLADVRQILDRASFLPQEHGRYFNAFIVIYPPADGTDSEQVALVQQFYNELEARMVQAGTSDFAALGTLERNRSGLEAHIAAHTPTPIGADMFNGLQILRSWFKGWKASLDVNATLSTFDGSEKPAKFHWRAVRDLLGALHPQVEAEDQDGNWRSARMLLKLGRHHRDVAAAPTPLVASTGLLERTAMEAVLRDGPPPLSVFADAAWEMVFTDWEKDEHRDRRRERLRREQQIEGLAGEFKDANVRSRQEQLLRDSWSTDPHDLPRSWPVWWDR
jgi:hypothetical protein